MKPGTRVLAILSADKNTVKSLGPGVYVGDEVPPDTGGTGWLAELGVANPKIVLDNGDVVWGCECWWGLELRMTEKVAAWAKLGWPVTTVRIADERAKHRGAAS
jgi:hypothetical protein